MPALVQSAAATVHKSATTRENLRKTLLDWYDQAGRELPWRVKGALADPYRVWLSEIMLQQTTVAAVAPYFARFLTLWPDVAALAAAPRDDVLREWAGLGYYARARNLHAAAQQLAAQGFPADEAGWRAINGVGPYTAAAIAAISLGEATNVVDGNVERVISRLYAMETPLPAAKPELKALAAGLVGPARPGDWAQALMDLGATVCTPKSPTCDACPWREACVAFATGAPGGYPRRAPKAERPQRFGAAFRLQRDGALWLVRRPDQGLLGGMAALPTTDWRGKRFTRSEAMALAPVEARWTKAGEVRHVFTHFALTLDVYAANAAPAGEGFWGDAAGLPTVFRKAAEIGSNG
ncbi:A/G-specific adenine glycosylase [Terricaulis sp.]|uniref:A/G-specific adenine glycosylase n=1 Tax=Terricaulis sp. TaxID=2768686 RepID=UPI0037850FD7